MSFVESGRQFGVVWQAGVGRLIPEKNDIPGQGQLGRRRHRAVVPDAQKILRLQGFEPLVQFGHAFGVVGCVRDINIEHAVGANSVFPVAQRYAGFLKITFT